ncbi:hypothetical protein Tco_0871228, partial [Tanacetum coccineum]
MTLAGTLLGRYLLYRALLIKWRPKVMAIEESKDLSTLLLDELIKKNNLVNKPSRLLWGFKVYWSLDVYCAPGYVSLDMKSGFLDSSGRGEKKKKKKGNDYAWRDHQLDVDNEEPMVASVAVDEPGLRLSILW